MDYSNRLKKKNWEVRKIERKRARNFIIEHHYSKSCSIAWVDAHGLFKKGEDVLYGVAYWLPPAYAAARSISKENHADVLSLSRMVVLDEVPKNGASFLLMSAVKLLDKRWKYIVTYADEWQNHTGHIYRACGWEYLGKTVPKRVYMLDGRVKSQHSAKKWYTHDDMMDMGAEYLGRFAKHKYLLER